MQRTQRIFLFCSLCLAPFHFSQAQSSQMPLSGMLDVHVHSAPDSMPRSIDAFEAARNAERAGMRAIVFKNHYTQTASLAYLVAQQVTGVEVYGGIALNRSVGGLNSVAIDHMVRTTGNLGKIVWMPTFDSEHYHLNVNPNPNHVAVSSEGELLPEVFEVLQTIKDNDLALATGHSSPEESLMIIRAAREMGIDKIIVTHPSLSLVGMTIEQQKEAAVMGAYLEYAIGFALNSEDVFQEVISQIRELGAGSVILSTDLGQPGNPDHTDGLLQFISQARQMDVTESDFNIMLKQNPARLLGLDE